MRDESLGQLDPNQPPAAREIITFAETEIEIYDMGVLGQQFVLVTRISPEKFNRSMAKKGHSWGRVARQA